MSYDILLVNGLALLLIVLVLWWFFGSKPKKITQADLPITVLVKDGIYQPAYIKVKAGKPITIHFRREDVMPCTESVIFPQLNLAYQLPINKTIDILIPPQARGEIEFVCQMRMYRGKIIVE